MQCFERALMRHYLFDLARELDPGIVRDDLQLDELLEHRGVGGLAQLLGLGTDAITALVHELVTERPVAARRRLEEDLKAA